MKIIGFINKHKWMLPAGSVAVVWEWFRSPHDLPLWLIVIMAVGTVLFLLLVFFVWKNAYGKNSYTADEIDGNRWMWNYANGGEVVGLTLCCSQCGIQLPISYSHPIAPNGWAIETQFIYECSNLKCKKSYLFTGLPSGLKDAVIRQIHGKLNFGTWKVAIKENAKKERAFKQYN